MIFMVTLSKELCQVTMSFPRKISLHTQKMAYITKINTNRELTRDWQKFYLHNCTLTLYKAKNGRLGKSLIFLRLVLSHVHLWHSNLVSAAPFSPWWLNLGSLHLFLQYFCWVMRKRSDHKNYQIYFLQIQHSDTIYKLK